MNRRRIAFLSALLLARLAGSAELSVTNGKVSIEPLGAKGAYTGFRLTAGGKRVAEVTFGSVGNITAARASVEPKSPTLVFTGLKARPTPALGGGSKIAVRLLSEDPYPRVEFSLDIEGFDQAAWEKAMGTVPFHFLCLSQPGAEILHHRGWSIPTPVLDPYPLHNTGTGYGIQIRSFWSKDWTYAPPVGAYPLATAGLWTPEKNRYVAFDFHEARLTDHSERDVATAYCWRHKAAREFIALVWPYARPYQKLRYPEAGRQTVASHFRILYSFDMPSEEDPNRFVTRFFWQRFSDRLPGVPRVNDLSWLSAPYRITDFERPRGVGGYHRVTTPKWWKTGTISFGGVLWDGDPITYLYESKQTEAIAKLKKDVDFVLKYTKRFKAGGEDCVFWTKPLEGEAVDMFGPAGVPTLRNIQGWQFALALLDICRNDPAERERLLPYVDGALRWTAHMLTTRNGYADVPCAQFCWGAGPVTSFCLRYHYTFRNDPTRKALAERAGKLAHAMLYRFLPIWASDSNPDDDLDSAYMLEPNSGISWLGAACSNEVWVIPHAVAQVYVATGDPILGHYLRGMLERWHWLFRDELYPNVAAYGNSYTERLGLYDGSAQKLGTRATFGGLWGLFERYAWPMGNAKVRVLCGEKAAMAFNRGGRHTTVSYYDSYGRGAFAVRLAPAADHARQPEPFDVMFTFPYFDLRPLPVSVLRGKRINLGAEAVKRYPQRPDTITVRGVCYGDTVLVGEMVAKAAPAGPLVARVRGTFKRSAKVGSFTCVPLTAHCNQHLPTDWDDPKSWAGLPAGRIWRYGVPFDLVDPLLNKGKQAVRDVRIPVGLKADHLFVLIANASGGAQLTVRSAGGSAEADLAGAVPTLKGWPSCFEWHADLLALPTPGRTAEAIEFKGLDVLAVTVFDGDPRELAATLDALKEKRDAIIAERKAGEAVHAQLAKHFERLSGRIAVLPQPNVKNPQSLPIVRILRKAGLLKHVRLLTPQQLVDPSQFSAQRIWVALYLGQEDYWATVRREGDAADALRRFMRSGGTLVAMPTGPFPFYYAGKNNDVAILARELGLPICGSGALERDDRIQVARVGGWEKPPEGVKLTFHLADKPAIISGLPKTFPFPDPEEHDPRWRPIVNVVPKGNVYTPILTLRDDKGRSYGEAAAVIDYQAGPLKGARTAYVWSTLAQHPQYQAPLIVGMLRHILSTTQPPLARHVGVRASGPVKIDGKLDERAWAEATPLPLAHCYGPRYGEKAPLATAARMLWDDTNLYVAFECEDPDIFGRTADRDSELWEEEVVEVYIDPDGDGKDYLEFEVNPRNAVIDLKIPSADQVEGDNYKRFRRWDAKGWKTAVHVEGTLDNRTDADRRWTVEMAIPFSALGTRTPKLGATWRVQLYRIDRSKPLADRPMFAAWSATRAFHDPTRFGVLLFGANPAHEGFSLYPEGSRGRPTWTVTSGSWRIEKGQLIGEDCLESGWATHGISAGSPGWTDCRLTLRFRILERGSDHRDGPWIAFRHTGPGSCYALHLGPAVQLHKSHLGRHTSDHTCLAKGGWEPDAAWHTLTIEVRGSRIATHLDSKPLLSATDADGLGVKPIPSGGIALSARRWNDSEGHTRVAFDDIELELLGR